MYEFMYKISILTQLPYMYICSSINNTGLHFLSFFNRMTFCQLILDLFLTLISNVKTVFLNHV